MDLDRNQQAAVEAGPTDVFISAGAGSGKTRVLTARFVDAVLGAAPYEPVRPESVLTVTYTEKAATELTERIRTELARAGRQDAARAVPDAWISTIHGMCARILRQHALAAGVDPLFSVLDRVDASVLEEQAFDTAVREALEASPDALALVDKYGFANVASAVRALCAGTLAMGQTPDSAHTVDPAEARAAIARAADRLSGLAGAFAALRQTATVAACATAAAGLADEVRAAGAASADQAAEAAAGLKGGDFRVVRSIEGHAELVAEAREALETARSALVQVAVVPHIDALIGLASRYHHHYATLKRQRGALDFDDLQTAVARLFVDRPDVAAGYRDRFAMVMIDEFQDTNALQLSLIEAVGAGVLCSVGDENQSIYAFRHADVDLFRRRAREVAERHRLDTNYRTAPALLDAVNGVFSSPALLGKTFIALKAPEDADRTPGSRFTLIALDAAQTRRVPGAQVEAEYVADRVAELLADGVGPGDVAVLLGRFTGGRATAVARALERRGVPVFLPTGGDFFGCREVVEMRALLRVVDNTLDDEALISLLAGRLVGLTPDGLYALCVSARERCGGARARDGGLWGAVTDCHRLLDLDESAIVGAAISAITRAREAHGARPLESLILDLARDLDVDLMHAAEGADGRRSWANIRKLMRLARDYERASAGGLGGFLRHLEQLETHAMREPEAVLDGEMDAVRVMTIHASKGLEFPHVIVAGLKADTPPASRIVSARIGDGVLVGMRLPDEDETRDSMAWLRVRDELRRVGHAEAARQLYVACTRAEESLSVVFATNSDKDASDAPGDRLRRAVGLGDAGVLTDGERFVGSGRVDVRVIDFSAAPPGETPGPTTGQRAPAGTPGTTARAATPTPPASVPAAVRASTPVRCAATPAAVPVSGISYTSLSTFEGCPYRYYLTSVARMSAPPAASGRDAAAVGSAVHTALQLSGDRGISSAAVVPSVARAAGLSAEQARRAEAMVEAFQVLPVAREIERWPEVRREEPMSVPVAGTVLVGAIDLIAVDGPSALVVDYKTGAERLPPEEAKRRYRLQGECYALAAFAMGATRVRAVFAELAHGREVEFTITADERSGIEERIASVVGRISAGEYPWREEYERALCESCPGLGGMCPITRPHRGDAE